MNYKILNDLPKSHRWQHTLINKRRYKGIIWSKRDIQQRDTILLYKNWSSVHFNSDWYEISVRSITGETSTARDIHIIKSFFNNSLSAQTRLIDVNCGSGRHLYKLSEEGVSCVGMEGAVALRKAAKERAKNLRTPYTIVSTSRFYQKLFARSADIVISLFNSIGYTFEMEDDIKRLQWMAALLKSNGFLLLDFRAEDFQRRHYGKPTIFQEQLYPPDSRKFLPTIMMKTTKYWSEKILAAEEMVTYKDRRRETVLQHTTYGWRTYSISETRAILEKIGLRFITYRLDYYTTEKNKSERIFILAQKI